MSEQVKTEVTNEAEKNTAAAPAENKQPVAQGTPATTKKPESWIRRHIVNPIKRNKKAILAGLGGVAAGAGGTILYGVVSNKRAEKRREQYFAPAEEPENPLDPNL